jgi:hypothetical protein
VWLSPAISLVKIVFNMKGPEGLGVYISLALGVQLHKGR